MQLPIFSRLAHSRSVLLAGCGGGYDVASAIPLWHYLRAQGKSVVFANRWWPEKYADRYVGKQKLKRQRADALFCVCGNTINTLLPPLPRAEYKEKWY